MGSNVTKREKNELRILREKVAMLAAGYRAIIRVYEENDAGDDYCVSLAKQALKDARC